MNEEKRVVAEAAAVLVEDGMTVGLGTGSTVAYLLPALAARRLDITCVSTSVRTEEAGRKLGLDIVSFSGSGAPARLDIAIDGADQVAPDGWLVKGGGAAHTREKLVEAAADRFVVMVSSEKLVEQLAPPIPLELHAFGLASTLRRLDTVALRNVPGSPDGGVIADWLGSVGDPSALASFLSSTPGVIEHGLFPPHLVGEILVGRGASVERRVVSPLRD